MRKVYTTCFVSDHLLILFGALFSRLLASSVAVHQLYDLAVPADLPPSQRVTRKQTVKGILCSMLDVGVIGPCKGLHP